MDGKTKKIHHIKNYTTAADISDGIELKDDYFLYLLITLILIMLLHLNIYPSSL